MNKKKSIKKGNKFYHVSNKNFNETHWDLFLFLYIYFSKKKKYKKREKKINEKAIKICKTQIHTLHIRKLWGKKEERNYIEMRQRICNKHSNKFSRKEEKKGEKCKKLKK